MYLVLLPRQDRVVHMLLSLAWTENTVISTQECGAMKSSIAQQIQRLVDFHNITALNIIDSVILA